MTLNKEQERLAALYDLNLLDTDPEPEFNDIVSLASDLCGSPISLITLLDTDRQWFKAIKGLSVSQTERSVAFCDKALMQDDIFVVSDASTDPRFADNPLVTGDPNIRFYAGALIHSPGGHKLGTLCIIDREPRQLSWKEAGILNKLASQASALIELRARRAADAAREQQEELRNKETAALRRKLERLTHLSTLQNESVAAFFDNGMDALFASRFSKKEVTEITTKAKAHRQQIGAMTEGLALLGEYNKPTPRPVTAIALTPFVNSVFEYLLPLVRSSGNKVQPLITSDLVLHQDEQALRFLMKTLLGGLLGALSGAEFSLLTRTRDGGVQFDIQIPDHNLTDALQRYLPDAPQLGLEHLSGRPFHVELALARDLVQAMGGSKYLQRLGNRGTAIEIFLPDLGE